jgi:dTDP-4-dehydrorhamnose reductase
MSDPLLLLTGHTGYLGHELLALVKERGIEHRLLGRSEGWDLAQPFRIEEQCEQLLVSLAGREVTLIHMAAASRWMQCEEAPDLAYRINSEATGAFLATLARHGQRLVYVSTDLVFDGEHAPYDEDYWPRPSSVYGKTKYLGEQVTLSSRENLVVRLPLLYGPSLDGKRGASDSLRLLVEQGESIGLFTDEWRNPMQVGEGAKATLDLALDREQCEIRHRFGPERLSRWELGLKIAKEEGLDPTNFHKASRLDFPGPERPRDTTLTTLFP